MKKKLLTIVLSASVLASCAGGWEQVDDAFTLPHPEYDAKWHPEVRWTMEDIHVYVNREYSEKAKKSPKFRNRTCLPSAEAKYKLALQYGYDENDLEIVVIKLSQSMSYRAYWPENGGWPTHAVLRYKDQIYDNGFISNMPFHKIFLTRYGEQVKDRWSKYRKW